jgi:hypothetical protein
MNTPAEMAYEFVKANHQQFEDMILVKGMYDLNFFKQVQGTLCRSSDDRWVDEFKQPGRVALWRSIYMYNCMFSESKEFAPLTPNFLQTNLNYLASNGEHITPEEIPQLMWDLVNMTNKHSNHQAFEIVRLAFDRWLLDQKRRVLCMRTLQTGEASELTDQLQRLEKDLRPDRKRLKLNAFGSGIDSGELKIDRLQTRFTGLDIALGGGPGRKEGYLVIAGQGCGKTVFSCQISSSMAIAGYKGILISTEQDHSELEPRIVSCHANIPFNLIKDKIVLESLQPDQVQNYRDLRTMLRGENYNILDWNTDRTSRIKDKIPQIVEDAAEEMGGLDFVFLDWIGSALGKNASSDPQAMRLAYQEAADAMSDAARAYNIVTFTFAQAHVDRAYRRVAVDSTCLAECKQLGVNMTGILGLTGLLEDQNNADNDGKPLFTPHQWIYISKARKSAGNKVPFRREFNYQRMAGR